MDTFAITQWKACRASSFIALLPKVEKFSFWANRLQILKRDERDLSVLNKIQNFHVFTITSDFIEFLAANAQYFKTLQTYTIKTSLRELSNLEHFHFFSNFENVISLTLSFQFQDLNSVQYTAFLSSLKFPLQLEKLSLEFEMFNLQNYGSFFEQLTELKYLKSFHLIFKDLSCNEQEIQMMFRSFPRNLPNLEEIEFFLDYCGYQKSSEANLSNFCEWLYSHPHIQSINVILPRTEYKMPHWNTEHMMIIKDYYYNSKIYEEYLMVKTP